MKTDKAPRCHWCPSEADKIDYREVDGITSKIASCDFCASMSTAYLLDRKHNPRPDCCDLEMTREVYAISYKHIWYEVHVDSTGEREIEDTFAEYGKVTPEIYKHLKDVVSKIDNI